MNSSTLVKVGVFLSAALFLTPFNSTGQAVNSDSWAATDALGRKVRAFEDAGTKKKDKYVAIFYWTWHIYNLPKGFDPRAEGYLYGWNFQEQWDRAIEIDPEFKWNDNMQENGNIMDFYVNGDTAPGGRFNFVYTSK